MSLVYIVSEYVVSEVTEKVRDESGFGVEPSKEREVPVEHCDIGLQQKYVLGVGSEPWCASILVGASLAVRRTWLIMARKSRLTQLHHLCH